MGTIRRSSCSLLWNGEVTNSIRPSRGIKQGDPLPPCLFVSCMERLSCWILSKVEQGAWKPLKASRSGVRISYICFADDLLLFTEAASNWINCTKEGLVSFCAALRQKINFAKSIIYFSPNIPKGIAKNPSENLGIPRTREMGRYLGHQVVHQERNKKAHEMILQKVRNKLDGWKSKTLSRSRRITLAQSVISNMANFQMQVQRLPIECTKNLTRM